LFNRQQIEESVISADDFITKDDFVGACVYVNEGGEAVHAGLFIKYRGNVSIFHFDGKLDFDQNPQGKGYYYKEIGFIKAAEVRAFLAFCRIISKKANPVMGYFYPGSFFLENGDYFSQASMPQYMTCVGFCLNVLKGFRGGSDFVNHADWGNASINGNLMDKIIARAKSEFPDINMEKIIPHMKRIRPDEYISAAFFDDMPVSKLSIDEIISDISECLYDRSLPA